MKSKKFVKDYRLKDEFLANGKIKTKAEYVGDFYFFSSDKELLEKHKKAAKIFCVLTWVLFVCALIPLSSATKLTYVVVPFVLTAFPLIFLSDALLEFIRANQPLTRQKADKLINRLPICSFLMIIFCGGSFVAFLVKLIISPEIFKNFVGGNIIFMLCQLLITFAALFIFKNRKVFGGFKTKENKKKEQLSSN